MMNSLKELIVFLVLLGASSGGVMAQDFRVIVFDFNCYGEGIAQSDGIIVANTVYTGIPEKTRGLGVTVLERERLNEILAEIAEGQKNSGIYDEKTAVKVGKLLNANYAILGSVSKSSALFEGINISARLVDISTGEIKRAKQKTLKSGSDYERVMNSIVNELLQFMGLKYYMQYSAENCIKETLNNYKPQDLGTLDTYFNTSGKGERPNVEVYLKEDPDFQRMLTNHAQMGQMRSTSEVVGIMMNPSRDVVIVVNVDGVYWKFSQDAFCSNKYSDRISHSGGLSWEEFAFSEISVEEMIYTVSDYDDYTNQPIEETYELFQLKINDEIVIYDNVCFKDPSIFEIKNIFTQLKACKSN